MSKKEIYSNSSTSFGYKFKTFFLRNRKRNLKALLSIFICLILVVVAVFGSYMRKYLKLINYSTGEEGNPDATFASEEEVYEDENMSFASMNDITDPDSLKDLMKSWATNGGEQLNSKNVINVLLIGADSADGSSRSDSMILASVNTKTKKITLCSFMRDSYTYMNIKKSNGSYEERYDKTNHAYCWAGASAVMEIISDNYKIKVDHYVSIDFKGFKKAIDQLGGVSVPITEKEAAYMNRTTTVKGFTSGDSVKLNGERALIYARIRKLDSEVERTRRQRNVIASVVNSAKSSSLSDINSTIEKFLPYVTTNYKSSEIISLATKALNGAWYDYEIVGMVEPSESVRVGVNGFQTYTGKLFVWIVDYIKAAQEVQNALYGTTNIEISADHVSPLSLVNNSGYTGEVESYSYTQATEVYTSPPDSTSDTSAYYYDDTTESTKIWEKYTSMFNPGNITATNSFDDITSEIAPSTEPSTEPPAEPVTTPSTEPGTQVSEENLQ